MAHASFVLVMVGQAVIDGAAASLLTSARAVVVRRLRGISSSKIEEREKSLHKETCLLEWKRCHDEIAFTSATK